MGRVQQRIGSAARGFLFLCPVFFATATGAVVPTAWASGPPHVYFDLAPVVACRDVTPKEFAEANPDEKLVQATFAISSLISSGDQEDLLQFFYRVESLEGTLQVFDYSPKTTLASEVAGNIGIEKKNEKSKHISLAVSGAFEWPVSGSGSGNLGSKSVDAVRYELVPQMVAVAASGTIRRGAGVYFKLRPSRSTSLEGAKEFTVVFRVGRSWRADCIQVMCKAVGIRRGVVLPLDDSIVCGQRRFLVALYLEGDLSAKAAAERFAHAASELRKTIAARRRDIEKRLYPTIVHRVGVLLDVIEPALPRDWADHLICDPDGSRLDAIAERLPSEVRDAVAEYALARRELFRLDTPETVDVQ